jgi:hypothetical protein
MLWVQVEACRKILSCSLLSIIVKHLLLEEVVRLYVCVICSNHNHVVQVMIMYAI